MRAPQSSDREFVVLLGCPRYAIVIPRLTPTEATYSDYGVMSLTICVAICERCTLNFDRYCTRREETPGPRD
jgi:hypothetical protein